MSLTTAQVRESLAAIPSVNLGFFPTPLQRLDNLSEELGVNLFIKRDDFTGSNLFGGNKTRKLEYLIGRARRRAVNTLLPMERPSPITPCKPFGPPSRTI